MLELSPVAAVLIRCFGEPASLNGFPAVDGAAACRIAPDELILVGSPNASEALMGHATAHIGNGDLNSLVIPHTDAWSFWMLWGEDAGRAFMRISTNPLPPAAPAFIQGSIGQLPGKALFLPHCIVMMVPSPVGHHLPEQVLAACADLNPKQGETRPLVIQNGICLLTAPAEVVAR